MFTGMITLELSGTVTNRVPTNVTFHLHLL
jgi:hypothetical protein